MIDPFADTSRVVERLIIKDYVHKVPNPEDKRLVEISINEKGIKLVESIFKDFPELDELTKHLSAQENKHLHSLLRKTRKK